MKRKVLSNLTKIMCIIFAIWTIIIILFAYNLIDYKESYDQYVGKFINAYIIYLLIFVCSIGLTIILNIRKLKWIEVRKRMINFIKTFVVFVFLTYVLKYVFKSSQLDLLEIIYNSIGLSAVSTFSDLIFFREKNTEIV